MAEYGQLPETNSQKRKSVPPSEQSTWANYCSELATAEAWARSTGLASIPEKPPKFNGFICFVLAWFWIFPAIIYYLWWLSKKGAYDSARDDALRLWKKNDSPDPFSSQVTFASEVQSSKSDDLATKLEELASIKDKGLLTEDEFVAAKRKLLGI